MRITSNMQTTYYDLINKDKLFDSHTHLNHKKYDKCQKKVISKLKYNVIDISIDLNSSYRSIEISKQFPNKISSCVGVDPEVYIPGSELYKDKLNIKEVESELDKLISTQRRYISMIGETGMDNYWLVKNKEKKSKESLRKQEELFRIHIALAKKYELPLSIHSRNAVRLCIDVIKDTGFDYGGSFHSLTPEMNSDAETYRRQIDQIHKLGFHIGINGIYTYSSAKMIREVINTKIKNRVEKWSSLEKQEKIKILYNIGFVFETDAPYLIPRGYNPIIDKTNDPNAIETIFMRLDQKLS